MSFSAPRGMRDFYPEDYRRRETLFRVWREVADLYGFEGYDAPVVETEELLKRKGGEEITQQIYSFEDKSGRRLALRPEMTPSLARMIIEKQGSLPLPVKWSAIAQCFRYERMTRGRKREHFQWNLDIIGEKSVLAEAEIIGAAIEAMRRLGLTDQDFRVRVGSRALLGTLLGEVGIPETHFQACYLALDKRGKITDEETKALLAGEGLKEADIERVFKLLEVQTLDEVVGLLPAGHPVLDELRQLFAVAESFGFASYLKFDVGIVRGLGYYTGIVFEAFDTQGKLRAIFGGGRYDNLLSDLGGKACPTVGLGFGDVVVMELLADLGRLPPATQQVEYAVGYMNAECRAPALQAASRLRKRDASVDLALEPEAPKKFFARASRVGARRSIFVGPDELANGSLTVKDMATREQKTVKLEEL